MNINQELKSIIIALTDAKSILKFELIQSLWSGYGEIIRVYLDNIHEKTVVIKHVKLPSDSNHPLGWNTNFSHQRKIKSYEVEMNWYNNYSKKCDENCRIPQFYFSKKIENEYITILEDIDAKGFQLRKKRINKLQAKSCLKWLANFHTLFLNENTEGLWQIGTYWHLDTRPEELSVMKNIILKQHAEQLDQILNNCKHKTLVHGDAKLENFCFSEAGNVAVVDFQYVGGGCGIKDVVYFFESALDENQLNEWSNELLDYYFDEIKNSIYLINKEISYNELEKEWRYLFFIAYADFHRFLSGWSSKDNYLNDYNQRIVDKAIFNISYK